MSWLAGWLSVLVPLTIEVTPVLTEPLSRDHLKVAPVRLAVSLPDPPWWISTR